MHRLTAAFACLVSALPWIVISLIDAIFLLVEKHLTPTQRSTNGRDVNKNIFMNQFRPSVCARAESLELVIFNNEWVFLLIDNNIWTASSEFGTYRLCEQRRFRRACASAQSCQNLRCSLMQAVSQEEPSDRKPDPWPLWMAGHAQLKFVMTECSKTQIRLTGLNFDIAKCLARPSLTKQRRKRQEKKTPGSMHVCHSLKMALDRYKKKIK